MRRTLKIYIAAGDPLWRAIDEARRRFGISASELARRGIAAALARLAKGRKVK